MLHHQEGVWVFGGTRPLGACPQPAALASKPKPDLPARTQTLHTPRPLTGCPLLVARSHWGARCRQPHGPGPAQTSLWAGPSCQPVFSSRMNTLPKQLSPTLAQTEHTPAAGAPENPRVLSWALRCPDTGAWAKPTRGLPRHTGRPYLCRRLRPLPAACVHGRGDLVDVVPYPSGRWHLVNVLGWAAGPWGHLVKVWGWAGKWVMGHLLQERGRLLGWGRLELWAGPRGLVEALLSLAGGGHQVDAVGLRWV